MFIKNCAVSTHVLIDTIVKTICLTICTAVITYSIAGEGGDD